MRNSKANVKIHSWAALVLISAQFCASAGTGMIQGTLEAKGQEGSPYAVESTVEALNATTAVVVQTALVGEDGSFVLTLPSGGYRLCFRFAANPGNYGNHRYYYSAGVFEKPPIIPCFADATLVTVTADGTTMVEASVGYNLNPYLVALSEVVLAGTVTDADDTPLSNIRVELLYPCSADVVFSTYTDEGEFKIGRTLPLASGRIRFSDPSGRYATSFYGADDFLSATLVASPKYDIGKQLEIIPCDIEVAPLTHDFGNVVLPGSATAIVTLANQGGADLHITSIDLVEANTSYIAIQSAPAVPTTLTAGQSCEVLLEFEPHTLGEIASLLVIGSDDSDEDSVAVALSGTGAASSAPPADQIATTLLFIAETVTEGSLQGTGPGGAGSAHVQALMDQIKAASDLAAAGKLQAACRQLENASRRTDGDPQPMDFVTGSAAVELWLLIELTRISMGCP